MEIIGVSFDEPSANQSWAEEEGFQFDLWSDNKGRTLALTYGAATSAGQAFADRVTVLLDAEGILTLEYLDVNVATNPGLVLEDCERLFGS